MRRWAPWGVLGTPFEAQRLPKSKNANEKNRNVESALAPTKRVPKGAQDLQNGAPRFQNGSSGASFSMKIERAKTVTSTVVVEVGIEVPVAFLSCACSFFQLLQLLS